MNIRQSPHLNYRASACRACRARYCASKSGSLSVRPSVTLWYARRLSSNSFNHMEGTWP